MDGDQQKLGPVIADLIDMRMSAALQHGGEDEMVWYRVLAACKARLLAGTGVAVPADATLASWMVKMRFTSVHDGQRTGLTPLRFAVLEGRLDLVTQLLDLGAHIEAPLRRVISAFDMEAGISILHSACSQGPNPAVARLLLDRGANYKHCTKSMGGGFSPARLACQYGRADIIDVFVDFLSHTSRGSESSNAATYFETPDRSGTTPLFDMGTCGHLNAFQCLRANHPELFRRMVHSSNNADNPRTPALLAASSMFVQARGSHYD